MLLLRNFPLRLQNSPNRCGSQDPPQRTRISEDHGPLVKQKFVRVLRLLPKFHTLSSPSLVLFQYCQNTGLDYRAVPILRKCCRQVEAEVVSNSRNKVHQTWECHYSPALCIYSNGNGCIDLISRISLLVPMTDCRIVIKCDIRKGRTYFY